MLGRVSSTLSWKSDQERRDSGVPSDRDSTDPLLAVKADVHALKQQMAILNETMSAVLALLRQGKGAPGKE